MINGRIYFSPIRGGGLASLTEAGSGVRARRSAARQAHRNDIRKEDEWATNTERNSSRRSISLTSYPARGDTGLFVSPGHPNTPNLRNAVYADAAELRRKPVHVNGKSQSAQEAYEKYEARAKKNLERLAGTDDSSLFNAYQSDQPEVKKAVKKLAGLHAWNDRAKTASPEMSDEEKAFRLRRHQRKRAEKSPGGSKLRRERKRAEREFHNVHGWQAGDLRRKELSGEPDNHAASESSPEEPKRQDSFPKEPEKPSETRPGISGKHVAGAALAVTGITGAALAARHIYKKRKARKEAAKKASSSARARIK